MRRLSIWVLILGALLLGAASAHAISKNRAIGEATMYQNSRCGNWVWACINPKYGAPVCQGPFQGGTQFTCTGYVREWYRLNILTGRNNYRNCLVLSNYDAYGHRVYGDKICSVPDFPVRDR